MVRITKSRIRGAVMGEEIIRIDLDGVNSYLVKSNDSFVLFDTGGPLFKDKYFTDRRDKLQRELEKAGCNQDNLKLLVLTHGDLDHVYNAAYIRNKYGLSIAIHANDVLFLENPTLDIVLGNFQFKATLSRPISKMMKHLLKKTSIKQIMDFHKLSPDILLSHNFDLKKYGLNATVLHVPGHTLGSIGILFESGKFISGDTFTNQNRPTTAPNAYDFKELSKSIDLLKEYKIITVYPGHGKSFSYDMVKERKP